MDAFGVGEHHRRDFLDPISRAQFDALRSPQGALLVGNADEVAAKIVRQSKALGGISRINFQMSVAALPHRKLMRAIELRGTRVAPMLHAERVEQSA